MRVAAGCLVRAVFDGEVRYLIVHPSGNYNRTAPYSIPKGLLDPRESPDVAALRETQEETGVTARIIGPLGSVTYRTSRKTVLAFLAEPIEPPAATTLEPGDWEVDRVEYVPAAEAREKLHPDQRSFIDRAVAFET